MEKSNSSNEIVLLMDSYSKEGEKLHNSLIEAGLEHKVIVLESDGFESDDVHSIYELFTGDYSKSDKALGRPLFFNQIKIPEFWDIEANNSGGKILDKGKKKGSIFYSKPTHKRLVRIVEWTDDHNAVRCSEHYNKYGMLFGRTIFNKDGEKVNKTIFGADGSEAVHENYVTGDIFAEYKGQTIRFKNKTDVATFVLKEQGYDKCRVFYNSLSYPFFISERLGGDRKDDVLFWQEDNKNEIPGNMKIILEGRSARTRKIVAQKKKAYSRLVGFGANKDILSYLGHIYPFAKENKGAAKALICTNSDQIVKLKEIVEALPEVHFYIAALTEMSGTLMDYDKYDNVSLYPNISMSVLDGLFEKCDIYLDINRYAEIVDAVYRAFLNNHVIFAFRETIHNEDFVADINVYDEKDYELMTEAVKTALQNENYRKVLLTEQQNAAMSDDAEKYKAVLE